MMWNVDTAEVDQAIRRQLQAAGLSRPLHQPGGLKIWTVDRLQVQPRVMFRSLGAVRRQTALRPGSCPLRRAR